MKEQAKLITANSQPSTVNYQGFLGIQSILNALPITASTQKKLGFQEYKIRLRKLETPQKNSL